MATNNILLKQGATQILFADHATDFGAAPATAANSLIVGTPTDVQIDLTGVAATGGARESAKVDLGATRAELYELMACIEFESAPADGGNVFFYWAPSPSSAAATGNPGGATGSDAAYTDSVGKLGQLELIGTLTTRNTVLNIGLVDVFTPSNRYGSLIIVNQASTALRSTATAMDETHAVLSPVVTEIQAAA